MITTHGLTMAKVTHVRQALDQICADSYNPRTMCARIMAEHGVTRADVRTVCDVAQDAVAERIVAARSIPSVVAPTAPSVPVTPATPDGDTTRLREFVERAKAQALGDG